MVMWFTSIMSGAEKLTKKANWNIKLALCFLHDKYETRSMTLRAFCTYLQKSGGSNIEEVMAAACDYP